MQLRSLSMVYDAGPRYWRKNRRRNPNESVRRSGLSMADEWTDWLASRHQSLSRVRDAVQVDAGPRTHPTGGGDGQHQDEQHSDELNAPGAARLLRLQLSTDLYARPGVFDAYHEVIQASTRPVQPQVIRRSVIPAGPKTASESLAHALGLQTSEHGATNNRATEYERFRTPFVRAEVSKSCAF